MKIITVIYHEEPEGWWAESPDEPSFFAAGDSREVVRQRVLDALPEVVGDELDYIDVDVGAAVVAMGFAADDTNRLREFAHGWTFSKAASATC